MNRENLKKLADYLAALPEDYSHFNMAYFARAESYNDATRQGVREFPDILATYGYNACGTVACACGHGPAAGLVPLPEERWWDYHNRVFALDDTEFGWAFGEEWAEEDNTPQGAALRIRMLLRDGEPPEGFTREGEYGMYQHFSRDLYKDVV